MRIILVTLFCVPVTALQAADQQKLCKQLLGLTESARQQLANGMKQGLIEIAPVHLPVNPPGDCNHYGWPIATKAGETIVLMHRRIPGHNPKGAGKPHEEMSYGIVLWSDNGGKSWSKPYDLRDCMVGEDRTRGGIVPLSHRFKFDKQNKSAEGYKIHLHAIGTTHDGAVVAINNHGVFRSNDRGRSWTHFSRALREDTFPHPIVNIGPNIIDHPRLGLCVFGNWFGSASSPKMNDQFVVLHSRDGGAHWEVESYDAGFQQYEPAALLHKGGNFLLIARNQSTGRDHQQLSWTPGKRPTVVATNMVNPRYVDTVDFALNPITNRFEVVRSERYRMQLWLWSIDPDRWHSGSWRRECRLLARGGTFYRDADGFHPASAVIDTRRGVQHIFIYSGHPNGPAGIFRITRTLDTPRLAALLQ